MLCRPLAELDEQAERIAQAVAERVPGHAASVVDGCSQMGSGSLPTQDLPTRLVSVAVRPRVGRRTGPAAAAAHARRSSCGSTRGECCWTPRTLLEGEESIVVESLVAALTAGDGA